MTIRGQRCITYATALALGLSISSVSFADYKGWLETSYPADGPGAAAIVAIDGLVVFRGAVGMADLEHDVALTSDSAFQIGSLTKQFTAATILLLEEQGKLSVDDSISEYLQGFSSLDPEVTVGHLLEHTSGISDYVQIPGYMTSGPARKDIRTSDLVAMIRDLPLNFPAGSYFDYTDSAYVLLGAIIEQVAHVSYGEFVTRHVFEPLELQQTYYGGNQIIPDRAKGYQGTTGRYRNADFISMSQTYAAGALLSTVDDLLVWSDSLFGGRFLSPESVIEMTTTKKLADGSPTGYGYGLVIETAYGSTVISHEGQVPGFSASAVWLPQQKVFAAVLSNNPENNVSPAYLARRFAFEAGDVNYPRLSTVNFAPETLNDYVGTYFIENGGVRNVILEAGMLYTVRNGQQLEILPSGPDLFYYPGSFVYINFHRSDDGAVVSMDIYYDGEKNPQSAQRKTHGN